MAKETGKVGRGGSPGSAQVGTCFILQSSTQTSGPFPYDSLGKSFSRTEGLGHGFEIGLSLLFEIGGSYNVLAALSTGDAVLERFQEQNGLGLCALRLGTSCYWWA